MWFILIACLIPGVLQAQGHLELKVEAANTDSSRKLQAPYDYVPSEGFGLARKDFISRAELPAKVRAAIAGAVRKICVCEAVAHACATFFSVNSADQFITNEHVAVGFYDHLDEAIQSYKKEGRPCNPELFAVEPNGDFTSVKLRPIKRGQNQFKNPQQQPRWDPKSFYEYVPDDHSRDLAIFEIHGLTQPVVPLKSAEEVKKDQVVYQAGFSADQLIDSHVSGKDFFPQVSKGSLKEIKEKTLETDTLGVPGMSGGPLLTEHGDLLGVFWGKANTIAESGELFNLDRTEWIRRYGHPRERAFFIPVNKVENFKRR